MLRVVQKMGRITMETQHWFAEHCPDFRDRLLTTKQTLDIL